MEKGPPCGNLKVVAQMIALDTNILARFYVDDPADPEAAKQRPIARRVLGESSQVFVPLTVIRTGDTALRRHEVKR